MKTKNGHEKNTKLIITTVIFLFLFCGFAVLSQAIPLPAMPSSFLGAALGALITVVVTQLLLKEQAAAEEDKERGVKIFNKKLTVYSQFMEHLWGMFRDSKVTPEELTQLRTICFQQLVFLLEEKQIEDITEQLKAISSGSDMELPAAAQITFILKENLNLVARKHPRREENSRQDSLTALFRSFNSKNHSPELDSSEQPFEGHGGKTSYWHFAMYDETQIKVLEEDNDKGETVLALFEIGTSWRTEYVRQVQPGDVIFLFKRGGDGYIGAFKAIRPEVIPYVEDRPDYTPREDVYDMLNGGVADYAANIIVRPVAFNYKGVGYKSPRRKTIEPINDREAVKYLLTRFSGNDLTEEQKTGMNKFEPGKPVNIQDVDQVFFKKLAETTV
ncbi:hypothetical protein FACS1894109_19870 [Spirochaetia bacterium]|nr:hypothetical protein FACS1894109_19870 [Spirochaetia bacterium]